MSVVTQMSLNFIAAKILHWLSSAFLCCAALEIYRILLVADLADCNFVYQILSDQIDVRVILIRHFFYLLLQKKIQINFFMFIFVQFQRFIYLVSSYWNIISETTIRDFHTIIRYRQFCVEQNWVYLQTFLQKKNITL